MRVCVGHRRKVRRRFSDLQMEIESAHTRRPERVRIFFFASARTRVLVKLSYTTPAPHTHTHILSRAIALLGARARALLDISSAAGKR